MDGLDFQHPFSQQNTALLNVWLIGHGGLEAE